MCDYSLMGVRNRLAIEGEELLVHRFPTGSIGLTASSSSSPVTCSGQSANRRFWTGIRELFWDREPQRAVAVCIPPGARLLVRDFPEELRRFHKIGSMEEVTFTQLSTVENTYRDAIRVNNGTEILLQRLREGQRVRVLQLSLPDGELAPVRRMLGVR